MRSGVLGPRRWAAGVAALIVIASVVSVVQLAAAPPAAAATTPTTVAAGWTHACLIRSGSAYCWGDNTYGELGNNSTVASTVPVPVYTGGVLSGVTLTQIATGNGFTCALSSGGAVYCWGANNYGELGINTSQAASDVPVAVSTAVALSGVTVTQISAGQYHACALGGGKAYCWGWNAWGQLGNNSTVNSTAPVAVSTSGVLSGLTVTQVTAGGLHSCALAGGKAYCWGGNPHGELGVAVGNITNSSVPVAVNTSGVLSGLTLTGIAAGYEHTCALSSAGADYCWGSDAHGELGIGSGTDSDVPVAVSTAGALSGVTVSQVTAGDLTSCALSSTGAGYCWGRGTSGELGNNGTSTLNTPQAVSTSGVLSGKTLSQISTGQQVTCALDSAGGSYCWGLDASGQAGDPATGVNKSVPVPVVASQPTTVTSGYSHSCEINPNGAAYCWGDDTSGELGNGSTTTPQKTPVAVTTSGALTGVTLTQISAGQQFTCALSTLGKAYCWGNDGLGQLGNSTTTSTPVTTPVAVTATGVLSTVTLMQISAGNSMACGLATTGSTYCWGFGTNGQLGNNLGANSNVPVTVTQAAGVLFDYVSSGVDHDCGLTPAGVAYCWGSNNLGSLGDNSTTQRNVPVAVYTGGVLAGVSLTEIASGNYFTCALSAAGAGYCWGENNDGQLGNNATSAGAQSTAVAMTISAALTGVTLSQVTEGNLTSCALSTAGKAYCWGYGTDGELGNGGNSNSSVAVAVSTSGVLAGKTLTQVSADAWQHTCGMGNTATMSCWGYGTNGQLGNNSVSNSNVPVTVVSLAPGAPTGVVAVPAGTSLTAYFTAPSSFGFGTLSNYTVTATPGAGTYPSGGAPASGSCTVSGTSCTVTGLTNGAVYLVTVTTNTTAGGSVASLPSSATVWPDTTAIATGYTHGCALSGGKAYCWGDDTYGELGNSTTTATPQTTPVPVYTGGALSGLTLTAISAGQQSTCALSSAGNVYCWGLGTSGQLGNNLGTSSSVPVAVGGALSGVTVTQVSVGSALACAVGGGAAYCWGAGSNGQLGNSATSQKNVPVAVSTAGALSGVTVTSIAAGNLHACATGANGAAYCWGYGGSGQLGNSSSGSSNVPVAVTISGALSGVTLTSVATTGGANNYMCALSSAGQAYCWGYGSNGQLGNSSTSGSNFPVAVTTSGVLYGTALASLTAGYDATCALSLTGAAYCWGDGGSGALGNNATSPSSSPVAVYTGTLLSGITLYQISAGELYSCVQDGTPYDYCWGIGSGGQLGDNSTTTTNQVAVYVAPEAPTGLGATMSATTAVVAWTAPAFTNSGTITGYTASSSPGSQTCTTAGATSCTISGLTAGVFYTITVTVTASPTGSASSSITAATTVLQLAAPASLTWSAADTGYNLPVVDQVSGDQQLTVTDTTGSGAGWHVTVSATTLTTGTYTLPNAAAIVFTGSTSSSASSSAPSTACVSSCTLLPTDTTTYPVSITTAASSPANYTVYDTAAHTGDGQITIGGSTSAHPVGWWVNMPGKAHTGTYTTTLTVEVFSGP